MSRPRPILLGIIGDSAAGKTTLTHGLGRLLGPERVTQICIDDYHKYDRKERAALGITALHPDCNYLDIVELHLERLHYGQPILKPVYQHSTGMLLRPEYVCPREIIIVEGLLGFHSAAMRQLFDVKVFLDPPEDLRAVWKTSRDTAKRGYTIEQVLAELGRREPDSRDFIRPQRQYADIVVQFYPPCGVPAAQAGDKLNARLVLRPTIPHPDLTYLCDEHAQHAGIRLTLGRDAGKPVDILEIEGNVTPGHAVYLEKTIWQHLPGIDAICATQFGLYEDRGETKHSDPLALTQLLLTYHLLRECRTVAEPLFAPPISAFSRPSAGGAGAGDGRTAGA